MDEEDEMEEEEEDNMEEEDEGFPDRSSGAT